MGHFPHVHLKFHFGISSALRVGITLAHAHQRVASRIKKPHAPEKSKVSLVSSVMSVIKDFEFGEWIFFHYIIIKYILL